MPTLLQHEILEAWDVEGIAADLARVCQQDGNDAPDPLDCVTGARYELCDEPPAGLCGWLDVEGRRIYYRPCRDVRTERWRMAHELAHLALLLAGIARDLHDERIVNQVARALLMPRRRFLQLLALHGSPYSYYLQREYPRVPSLQILQRAVELGY